MQKNIKNHFLLLNEVKTLLNRFDESLSSTIAAPLLFRMIKSDDFL